MVLWSYIQEHPNAQPAVVLAFKLLRRWLKVSSANCENLGIKPVTPGL